MVFIKLSHPWLLRKV